MAYPWHVALLGKELEDASRWLLDELEAAGVVGEGDVREHDLFDAVLEGKKCSYTDVHFLYSAVKLLFCYTSLPLASTV